MKLFNCHDKEKHLDSVKFTIYKFNNRPKPEPKRLLFMSCFSEFGCESIAVHYCIPRLVRANPGFYKIAVGWHGREYLYRHLVDEYWEISEDCQWLREYNRAFHYNSKNLTRIEKSLAKLGNLVPSHFMGTICLGNTCNACKYLWLDQNDKGKCAKCGSGRITRSIFGDVAGSRKQKMPIPKPNQIILDKASKYLGPKPVGIFARARKSYGRNLPPEFYIRLIYLLEGMGYTPIWLGEKQSTLECPLKHIVDFSRLPESCDLELTLAIVSKLEFTVQFWTASTRLAAMVGVPYLLFESPDQVAGKGQEGLRMALVTEGMDKKKLVLCHYLKLLNDQDMGLDLVEKAIMEMRSGNWEDMIGLVDQPDIVRAYVADRNFWGAI